MLTWLAPFFALTSSATAEGNAESTLRCDASSFKDPIVPGAKILSITAEGKQNVSSIPMGAIASVSGVELCAVNVRLTHPGTEDDVLVQTWLPLAHDAWNGRFQATGGGGFATGFADVFLGPAVKDGYAASATDGGHQGHPGDVSWGLNKDRSVNWNLLHNFASRSLADQIYVGKSITEQFFGKAPHHSYWNGCSTGGRQGYLVAQKYPGLLDGIYAFAPAISFVNLVMGDFWPQVVMKEEGALMTNCEFGAFFDKALEECDILDGVRDEVIEDPEVCNFDPQTLVGQKIECDGDTIEITKQMATVARKLLEGPKIPFGQPLWHGFAHGTSLISTANISVNAEGVRQQNPFMISKAWIQNLVFKDPGFNVSQITYSDFFAAWAQSSEQYSWLIDTFNTDLSAFRDAGGKLLTWHGTSDPLIPYQNTVQYRERVESGMGGNKAVNDFYRLFLAPGVNHCGHGTGPVPTDLLQPLVDWVEKGEPPETLAAETIDKNGEKVSRDLCLWPAKSKYMGHGDGKRASTWTCVGGADGEEHLGEARDFIGGLKDRLKQVGLDLGLSIG
jgi:hypothetical protein